MLVNLTTNLNQEYWQKLVKPFESKTGVTVKIQAPSGKSVAETFPTLLAAGTAPDVVQSIFPDSQTAQELVDLSGESWIKGTPMLKDYSIGGKNYVVGVGTQAQSVVYYNKDAFEKAGITATPTTWDEFTTDLGKLQKAGYTPLQTGGQYVTGMQAQQLFNSTLNTSTPNWQNKVASGKLNLGKAWEPMFEKYSKWISSGYIDKTDVGLAPASADANFIAGKAGMYPNGSWFVATLNQAGTLPFKVGVFSAPVNTGQTYPGPQGATMADPYMIYKGTKNEAAAKALVKYLVTDKTAIDTQLKADGVFRTGSTVQTSEAGVAVQKVLDNAPKLALVNDGAGDNRLPIPVGSFNPEFTTVAQSLYTGATPAQAADTLVQWYEQNKQG